MLVLPGNSEQAFAGLNAVTSVPRVFVEWNYNSVSKPYVVASSSAGAINAGSVLLDSSKWTTDSASNFIGVGNKMGYISDVDPSASSILLSSNSKSSKFYSPSVAITAGNNNYYKAVFYIKAEQEISYSNPKTIPASEITASPNVSGTNQTLYYRIVPVNTNGIIANYSMEGLDTASVQMDATSSSVMLQWDTDKYNFPAYSIYRSKSRNFLTYINTVYNRTQKVTNISSITNSAPGASITLTVNNASTCFVGEYFTLHNVGGNAIYQHHKAVPSNLEGTRWKITSINGNTINASQETKWLKTFGGVLYSTNYSIPTSYPNATMTMYSYLDVLSNQGNYSDKTPINNTKIRVMPHILLKNAGNTLENTRYYSKFYDIDVSEVSSTGSMFEIDGVNYKKIEVYFGSPSQYDSARLDLVIDATAVYNQVHVYRPEIYQITQWDFETNAYYPIDSVFSSNRPGEALLHPYLQDSDKVINKNNIGVGASVAKPVSFIAYNPDYAIGGIAPYKQLFESKLNNLFKYYISEQLDESSTQKTFSIRANYNTFLTINKMIIKGSNAFSDLTKATGSLTILTSTGSTTISISAGAFDSSGILDLYYDGSNWLTVRPAETIFPPKISDSAIVRNTYDNVKSIILNLTNLGNNTGNANVTPPIRGHIIEISPRLEVDVSNLVQDITVSKTLDNEESAGGFPLGYITANTGTITLSNVPVYRNNFPHTIFDPFSDKSTFSNVLRQGTKFTIGLESIIGDFTDWVPFVTMYSDDWDSNDTSTIVVNMFDSSQAHLMGTPAPDYMGDSEPMFNTITNILDAVGISDYDYDQLNEIMRNRATNTSHFWTDRKKQSVQDALKSFFISHQIGAAFDEYGVLKFLDLDSIISNYYNNTFIPTFAVTDLNLTLSRDNIDGTSTKILYIPNILKNTYNANTTKKIGKVSIQYKIPVKAFTDQWDQINQFKSLLEVQPLALWQSVGQVGVISSYANRSVLANDNIIYTNPVLTDLSTTAANPRNTIGGPNGTAFLQGELIHWDALEYKFSPLTSGLNLYNIPIVGKTFTGNVTGSEELVSTITQIENANPNILDVEFEFDGVLTGVSRGQKFTSIRNHFLFDDSNSVTGHVNPSAYFTKAIITSSTTVSPSLGTSTITFDKNVAKFVSKRGSRGKCYPLFLSPLKVSNIGDYNQPTSASNFNFFSFVFDTAGKNFSAIAKDSVEVGIYINGSSNRKFVFGIYNNKQTSYLASSYDNALGDKYSSYDLYKRKANTKRYSVPAGHIEVKNVFDGKPHRFSVIFHSNPDVNHVAMPDSNNVMRYPYCTFVIDNERYGPYYIKPKAGISETNFSPSDQFGFYVKNLTKDTANLAAAEIAHKIHLSEIYACKWWADRGHEIANGKNFWHWQSKYYLDKLINNLPGYEPLYYYWGPNRLTGVQFFEELDFSTSPAYGESMSLDFHPYKTLTDNAANNFTDVYPSSIVKSSLYATPFRASFAVVNNDSQAVFLSTADGAIGNNGQVSPTTINGFYNKLSEQKQIEKVIDPTSITNSIVLSSDWIQSDRDAEKLMQKVSLFANSFNADINVSIFGNPLIQVGDFGQLVYSVKKIGYDPEDPTGTISSKVFFVKAISHDYSSGLKTSLVLKPMFRLPQ
jgi:hypothetical protein